MKICRQCGVEKLLDEFYIHRRMADGHLNKCKNCVRKRVTLHRNDNLEAIQQYDRMRGYKPHRIQAAKTYAQTHPDTIKAIRATWLSKNPEKRAAHNAVNNAIRDGRLEKEACGRCGSLKAHGHHDDYSKPLEVMWLCAKHHKERHRELDALAAE